MRTLHAAGHTAYFAGGCVRDELLGLTPTDYDVATDAVPDRVQHLFPRSSEVGKSFGVVIVRVGRETVEVATFRADGEYTDRRRPDSVTFSSPEQDALRRDYTVNAIFLDISNPSQPGHSASPLGGTVIDFVQGLDDLAARRLRAVGDPDQRLDEDHLRALRAVRLSAKLAFTIEDRTADAIRRHASNLQGVSRERIGDEVERMLSHPARATAAKHLAGLGLLGPVLSTSVIDAAHSGSPLRRLHALKPDVPYPAALAAWALDLNLAGSDSADHALVSHWRRALCLSNANRDHIAAVLCAHRVLSGKWAELSVAQMKRLAASEHFPDALAVFSASDPQAAADVQTAIDTLAATPGGLSPPPMLDGDALVALGFSPGPKFKTILDRVYDAQLDGRVINYDQAVELARDLNV